MAVNICVFAELQNVSKPTPNGRNHPSGSICSPTGGTAHELAADQVGRISGCLENLLTGGALISKSERRCHHGRKSAA